LGVRDDAQYWPWEREMALTAERIDHFRARQVERSESASRPLTAIFLSELGAQQWRYRRGWSRDQAFAELLDASRDRDLRMGYTFSGPHRADWQLRFENQPESAPLSRGQEKLTALACVLAQIDVLRAVGHEPPVVLLDDLAAELDREHQGRVWRYLRDSAVQVMATGTELPTVLPREWVDAMFHVERHADGAALAPVS